MNPFPIRALTLTVSLLLGGCQQAYFGAINTQVAGGVPEQVLYDSARGLSMDVYRPADGRPPVATVVFFHGGSWRNGNRGNYRFVGRALAREGILVMIPDYRKAPAAVFPAFMDDAALATAWAIEHVDRFDGKRSTVFLMGHSAGAHIAALLATDAHFLQVLRLHPRDLAGVIGLAGPYDFLPVTHPRLIEVFGGNADWPSTQPVNFTNGDEPPFLLVHGGSDHRVGKLNSERLADRLRAAGTPVTLTIVPGTGHVGLVNGFLSTRFSPVLQLSVDWIGRTTSPTAGVSTPSAPAPAAR